MFQSAGKVIVFWYIYINVIIYETQGTHILCVYIHG